MSFSVYNGYSIPKKTIEELLEWTNSVRTELEEVKLGLIAKLIKGYKSTYPSKSNMDIALEIQNKIWANQTPSDKGNFNYWCLGLELVFIPTNDKILCMSYSTNKEIEQAWAKLPDVTPYWYSSRTDDECGCTEQEWSKRALDWEKALGVDAVPSKAGFTITVLDTDFAIVFDRNRAKVEALMDKIT